MLVPGARGTVTATGAWGTVSAVLQRRGFLRYCLLHQQFGEVRVPGRGDQGRAPWCVAHIEGGGEGQ